MKATILTVIPVYNAARFIEQTLQSLANQTVQPDRVVLIDNCSEDDTEQRVKNFKGLSCEWLRNPSNLGLFGSCNRALELTEQTEYFHILHGDDLIAPNFYETMMAPLESCDGLGMAYCLDQRIDEDNRTLSLSGRATGRIEEIPRDRYLQERAEIGNQAFSGTLLKSHGQPAPCQFRLDMAIVADMAYWADWGRVCRRIIKVNAPLCKYRWHGTNNTFNFVRDVQDLVLDEWRLMQLVESYRSARPSLLRQMKLKGLFAVRSGIKAKRFREQGNAAYSGEIVARARPISGGWLWGVAQGLVHLRDLLVYGILRRRKHPKNVYG